MSQSTRLDHDFLPKVWSRPVAARVIGTGSERAPFAHFFEEFPHDARADMLRALEDRQPAARAPLPRIRGLQVEQCGQKVLKNCATDGSSVPLPVSGPTAHRHRNEMTTG